MVETINHASAIGCSDASSEGGAEIRSPFLSVVIRTDGTHAERLGESLLCLAGQENTDFEILIASEAVTEESRRAIRQETDAQDEPIREKIRLIEGGESRGALLNRCLDAANGKYLSIIDEGDLLFDIWVEEFAHLDGASAMRTLHTYAICQEWDTVSGFFGMASRAVGALSDQYSVEFDLFREVWEPLCPDVSVALPLSVLRAQKIRFDEALNEDAEWEMRVRAVATTGICNGNTPTSIVRKWRQNAGEEEKAVALRRKEIYRNFKKSPALMKSGALEKKNAKAWKEKNQEQVVHSAPPAPAAKKPSLFYRILRKMYRLAKKILRRGKK